MSYIRCARPEDTSRIAEIFVFNNRVNFFPIFGDENFSFCELQTVPLAERLRNDIELLHKISVYDDGIVRGFVTIDGSEIEKLYVDVFFQRKNIGAELIEFAVEQGAHKLWVLEKNTSGIAFYNRHNFWPTGEKKLEEDTTEYLIRLERKQ